jgi:hypothetical protein
MEGLELDPSVAPASIADWPAGVKLLLLPGRTGKCTVISNTDLSLVDPSKVPRHTLGVIRLADQQSKKTRDEVEVEFPGNDRLQSLRFGERSVRDLSNALSQDKEAASLEGVQYSVISCQRFLDSLLDRKPPEWTLVKDERKGHKPLGGSVETAYKEYLKSCIEDEREPREGMPQEGEGSQAPQLATSSTTSDAAKPSKTEAGTTIRPSPSTTPQFPPVSLSSSLQPTGQAHGDRRPAYPRSARSALSARGGGKYTTVITLPVWPPKVINPICKTDNYSALHNLQVRTALYLCLEYCRSKEASEDPDFAERAMTRTLSMINRELGPDIRFKLAVRKGGTTEQIDGDRGGNPDLQSHSKKAHHSNDGAANSYLEDLKDAPGHTYPVSDPVGELKRRVEATMFPESIKSFVPGSTSGLDQDLESVD